MKGSILCIGVGPGIGFATALRFATEGYSPILAARNEDKLKKFAAEITARTGRDCEVHVVDAASSAQLASLIDKYGEQTEILFYNAAILRPQSISEATDASLENDMAVDLTGALISVRNILPYMKRKGHGSIFLTGGGFAESPAAEYLALSVGKAGLRCLCHALFDELRKCHIQIASILVRKVVEQAQGDPQKIADLFWAMFSRPQQEWSWEEIYE
ncbi:MAG: SDR family NAD(P)-dependent oxidoreductase [Desulfovibrio sp.]|nr:SDR family NAD(P)-dependent oxidoreductase [Desulfovibrio sp.]